jgi:hypothetical protein
LKGLTLRIGAPFLVLLVLLGAACGGDAGSSAMNVGAETTSDAPQATPTTPPTAPARAAATATPRFGRAPTVDAAVATYQAATAELFAGYATSMGEYARNFVAAGNNPALIFDRSWRTVVGTHIGLLQVYNTRLRALQPPACLQDGHNTLLEFTVELDDALEHVLTGLDNFNGEELRTGARGITTANTLLSTATDQMARARC